MANVISIVLCLFLSRNIDVINVGAQMIVNFKFVIVGDYLLALWHGAHVVCCCIFPIAVT